MIKKEELLDYEQMKQKALEQLRSGKSLYGKDGAFAPLLKSFLDAALQAEMESHLDEAERSTGNRRNGKTSKNIRTSSGTISVETPRDRASSFEPELIRKRETILAESLESKIIGMYGLGMSLRDISLSISRICTIQTSAMLPYRLLQTRLYLKLEWAIPAIGRTLYDCMAGCDALQSERRSPDGFPRSIQHSGYRPLWP
mgnify:CR=1 FL=1